MIRKVQIVLNPETPTEGSHISCLISDYASQRLGADILFKDQKYSQHSDMSLLIVQDTGIS